MTSLLIRASRRGMLSSQLGRTLANPLCSVLGQDECGSTFSTFAFLVPADLGSQKFVAAASSNQQPPASQQGSPPAAHAVNPLEQRTLSAAMASQPADATPAAAAAPTQERSLLERMLQAQARGEHAQVTAMLVENGLGAGQPAAAQKLLLECALRSCVLGGNAARAVWLVHQAWKRPDVYVGPRAHLWVLQACCNQGLLQQAWKYLVKIPSKRVTLPMLNALLVAAIRRGDTTLAQRVEALMQKRLLKSSTKPDALSFSALIELRGMEGDAAEVDATWQRALGETQEQAHPMLHAARVVGLARAHALDAAIDAVERMMDTYPRLLPVDISLDISPPSRLTFRRHQQGAGASPAAQEGPAAAGEAVWSSGNRQTSPLDYLRGACNAVLRQAEAAEDQTAVKRLTTLMTLRGLPPSTTTYNLLLRATVRRAHGAAAALQAVEDGMHEMEALRVRPNLETFELLIDARRGAGNAAGVRAALDAMAAAGVQPAASTWSRVMRAYGEAGDLEGVDAAFEQLLEGMERPSAGAYRAAFDAIHAWGTSEVLQRATNEAPAASLTNQRIFQKQLATAMLNRWATEMEHLGIRHTPTSFVALVHAFGYAGQSEAVVQLMTRAFGRRRAQPSQPAAHPAAAAAEVGGGAGEARQAREGPVVAEGGGAALEAGAYRLAQATGMAAASPSEAAAGSSSSGGAGVAVAAMVSSGGSSSAEGAAPSLQAASADTTAAAAAAHHQQQGETAQLHIERSLAPGQIKPDARFFSAAIAACSREGHLDDAVAMLRLMREVGLEPGVHTYTSLIACCAYVRMPGLARTLLGEMRGRGIAPTLWTYNAMLKVEAHCGSLDAAVQLTQDMEFQGLSPNAVSWRTLLSAAKYLGRSDVADMARRQLQGGVEEGEEQLVGEEGEAQPGGQQAQQAGEDGWHNYYQSDESDEEDA